MTSAPAPRPALEQFALQEAAGDDWSVRLYAEAGSTNALAADADARTIVVADHQTAGRGRLDRAWETPARSALTMSVVTQPDLPPERWPLIPLATGLAVARALGDRVALKWPNDALIDDAKVCGILVERLASQPPRAVVGIGINVDQTADELPIDTATSLRLAGLDTDRVALFGRLVRELERAMTGLAETPQALLDDYRARSATIGRDVRVELPGGDFLVGTAAAIDDLGRLQVRHDGGVTSVGAGDVVHVRPAQ